MKELSVLFLPSVNCLGGFDGLDKQLANLSPQKIDNLLWSKDGYKPDASFKIAHNGQHIFLKYIVFEDHITASHVNINDTVYLDTCVEFFISLGDDVNYYNLEFNRLGTCSIGYGRGKQGREAIPATAIEKIRSRRKMLIVEDDSFSYGWELILVVPITVFIHHQIADLSNLSAKANFYKCGDNLPQPHFLAWNKVEAETPNFHLSDFFGQLLFLSDGKPISIDSL